MSLRALSVACWPRRVAWILVYSSVLFATPPLSAGEPLPSYLEDRGPGVSLGLFGAYVERGEWVVYPFYEYTRTSAFEYKPSELGFSGGEDFLGKTVEHEYLLFLAYGLTDRLAVELEGAVYAKTTFDKAPNDPSAVPPRLEESGLGDVEGQLRWIWSKETAHRPELFGFFEVVFPFQKDKHLIGTQDWEASFGFGATRGFRWGTLSGRVALAYDGSGDQVELGEFGVDYLKKLSPRWRVVLSLEGESDELSLIGEAQWLFSRHGMLKLNCGFGLTEKAPDVAPEVGVLFHF
ncbi:MAG: hypothetical protein U0002_19965 [Thermoanaerobaculia bacterium]